MVKFPNLSFSQQAIVPLESRVFDCTYYIRDVRPHVTKLDQSLEESFWDILPFKRGINVIF